MKWLRILLATILMTENLLVPFVYVNAAVPVTEPLVQIEYTTQDTYTPEASEYVAKVNAEATNGKTYDFYTLSGVVKTVKALPKNESTTGANYDTTGEGAAGYVVLAYDRIGSTTLNYKDWIAGTVTNANGKFAIPIEKTQSGVFLVILKPADTSYKFLTSYSVSSAFTNRGTLYPENSLNIGVIDKVNIADLILADIFTKVPETVSMIDKESFWSCGENELSTFKYKHPTYDRSVSFDLSLTDKSYTGNTLSLRDGDDSLRCIFYPTPILGCGTTAVPINPTELYKGDAVQGRNDRLAYKNYTSDMSALSAYSGVLNRTQPINTDKVIPTCTRFLEAKNILTTNSNCNFYTCGGSSLLSLPNTVANKIITGEICEEVLRNTVVCIQEDGSEKTAWDLKNEGYEGIGQNFKQCENFEESYTSRKFENKVDNDSVKNLCPENDPTCTIEPEDGEEEFSRVDPFDKTTIAGRGTRMASVTSTQVLPKDNELKNIYSDALDENAPYRAYTVPFSTKTTNEVKIHEIGPLKSLCEISEVVKNGEKVFKNEERGARLTEMDTVAAGYVLTNKDLNSTSPTVGWPGDSVKFFQDPIKLTITNFVQNLVTGFKDIFIRKDNLAGVLTCLTPSNQVEIGRVALDESGNLIGGEPAEYSDPITGIKNLYGDFAVTAENSAIVPLEYWDAEQTLPKMERIFYYYDTYTWKDIDACAGDGKYQIKSVAKQIDEGNIEMKGTTPRQNIEDIRNVFKVPTGGMGDTPLSIGKAVIEVFEATGTGKPLKMFMDVDSTNAATDVMDNLRFSMSVPDGTQNQEKPYLGAVVRLIDRATRQQGEDSIFAGGGSGGGGGEEPPALETPGTCPIGNGTTCTPIISCESYPGCHGNAEYWSIVGSGCYAIPWITSSDTPTKSPIDSGAGSCNNTPPSRSNYGYALDVVSSCGDSDRNVYAPAIEDITEWTVTAAHISTTAHNSYIDIEGITSTNKTIKLNLYHLGAGDLFVTQGQKVAPGAPLGKYDLWPNNAHVHIEMLIDNKAAKPEDNLSCGG